MDAIWLFVKLLLFLQFSPGEDIYLDSRMQGTSVELLNTVASDVADIKKRVKPTQLLQFP